jgi:7-cyano-7-deazaguanine synthase in queuosine biosynthesis
MLTKNDHEYPINDYQSIQLALSQSTHAKNCLSIRHGYAPEIIIFGKHSRIPGSVLRDESIPSHELATREDQQLGVQEFKKKSLPYVKVPAKHSMMLTIMTIFAEHYFVEHAHIGEQTKKVNGS